MLHIAAVIPGSITDENERGNNLMPSTVLIRRTTNVSDWMVNPILREVPAPKNSSMCKNMDYR